MNHGSDDIMKNSTTRGVQQNYKCRDCGRQFVETPQWKRREPDKNTMIDESRTLIVRVRLIS
jgi:transposase-like protein